MIAALLLAASATTAPTTCPIERASYALRDQPGFTAEFHPVATNRDWPLGIALAVHAAKTGRTFWFLPWNGGTDDRMHLRWVPVAGDRLDGKSVSPEQEFLALDRDDDFLSHVPAMGGAAPARFVLPEFARELWYATAIDERDVMTQAFFDLASCTARPYPAVEVELPPVA